MGYAKIKNLYADQTVLMLKELYALEKVHGTSAHVKWNKGVLSFFAGGMGHDTFVELFDQPDLIYRLGQGLERGTVTVYGEAYGGKIQGMSGTYGVKAKFIGFDVSIDNVWLTVPSAAEVCAMLGIDFVSYERIPATLEAINAERDRPSAVATLNGVANPAKGREGVVLRL